MNSRTYRSRTLPSRKAGFALVVTLSLMILLTVIAVGMLSLASISLRSSAQTMNLSTARSNARMALMLAIGDLQKYAGSDTRITARADVLDEKNPPVMGVWKSWEGTDHEVSGNYIGRPVSPGDYKAKKEQRFLSWLVPGNPGVPASSAAPPDTAPGAGKITVLGAGSVGDGDDRKKLQVHLTPTLVNTGTQRGAYTWWVSGENQKAHLPKPHEPSADNGGRWAANSKSHAVSDTRPFDMEQLLQNPALADKGISLRQADFLSTGSEPASRKHFHDLSTCSVGLLTNSATGGWRKDLSLLTENWDNVGNSNLPFFRSEPGKDISFTAPTTSNAKASKSLLYPWSAYRAEDRPMYSSGAVSSWLNLKNYATAYKAISPVGGSYANAKTFSASSMFDGSVYDYLHKIRLVPMVARIQWVLSYYAVKSAAVPAEFTPALLFTPVITMWNPYNVEMTFSELPLTLSFDNSIPLAIKFSVSGQKFTSYHSVNAANENGYKKMSAKLNYSIAQAFTLKPGETRVFSPAATPVAANTALPLTPGYRSGGGHILPVKDDTDKLVSKPGTTTFKVEEVKFDTTFKDGLVGTGIYLNVSKNGAGYSGLLLAYRNVFSPTVATDLYKPVTEMPDSPALATAATNPVPFFTTVFGTRMASRTFLAAKGFMQSSPLSNYTSMGGKETKEPGINRAYNGTGHPVNSPFDYSSQKVTPFDSLLPNVDDADRGFIVTGFNSADGLSRCVVSEVPTRPLQSLGELQHWDLRYDNPIPPFAFNIIGNSDASSILPSDAVVNGTDTNLATNMQHDDSYCANHLLFDDWFVSSISPDPTTFGSTGRSMQKTYVDFVSGQTPLNNQTYKAIAEDVAFASTSTSNADSLYTKNVGTKDSWKSIASRFEVEGMFNVNSTSVTAWRALLGHARNQKVPFIGQNGALDVSEKSDYAFSRFSVAGDVEARSSGFSGKFPGAAEFSGYRVFNEQMLDALAREMVRQVRLRGPFLSLSEFVNRQLSSGDLALAGAIQTALNEIAKTPATNPYKEIELGSKVAGEALASNGTTGYKFEAAAKGYNTYGLPGWTRQADVLRPIAPILSARDDTFTIRAYGDARNAQGVVTARAVCEAVVRRTRNFMDPVDAADITTLPAKEANKSFGRRFEVISFRWLNPAEI